MFLKTERYYWSYWDIIEFLDILLKFPRYYWEIIKILEILLRIGRYYWNPWDFPEIREILLKLLRYYWIPWCIAEIREILLRLVRYFWNPWDIAEILLKSEIYCRKPWDITENREIFFEISVILLKSVKYHSDITEFGDIKIHSNKCRTYKNPFKQMQNLQQSIRSNVELTKNHSDKCRTYKKSRKFGQMHAPHCNLYGCILVRNIGLSTDNSYRFQFIDFTTAERAI